VNEEADSRKKAKIIAWFGSGFLNNKNKAHFLIPHQSAIIRKQEQHNGDTYFL
jgi:hypothetical protein